METEGRLPAQPQPRLPAAPAAIPPPLPSVPSRPPIGRFAVGGLLVIALFFGGFGAWAGLAPLAAAALATGTVRAESNRKTVQHLEGGIIAELLVHEGDRVTAGQVLVRLDTTAAASRHETL